jgi:tRNA-(ms[2]io[6]A)-hydroxylase
MVKIQVKPLEATTNNTVDIAEFLQEHADFERKSSDYALSIAGKFPEKFEGVSTLAHIGLGSLTIFAELCNLMQQRGVMLIPESPQNLYLKQLAWLNRSGREERYLDRLLLGRISETRCAKRFQQVSDLLEDLELASFYAQCARRKQQHADQYMQLAYEAMDTAIVNLRLEELITEEEKVMASQKGVAGIF